MLRSVFWKRFLREEDGPTAAEYAMMLALILLTLITVIQAIGTTTSGTFSKVNSAVSKSSSS